MTHANIKLREVENAEKSLCSAISDDDVEDITRQTYLRRQLGWTLTTFPSSDSCPAESRKKCSLLFPYCATDGLVSALRDRADVEMLSDWPGGLEGLSPAGPSMIDNTTLSFTYRVALVPVCYLFIITTEEINKE